jgi:enoyl-CoA hydratase/carnithine racemase
MEHKTIIFEKKDHLAKIILNRPEALNALNADMIQELGQVLSDIENDDNVRVVILSGAGKAFCVGMDLKFVKQIDSLSAQQELFRMTNRTVTNVIENLETPVIAAVNGYVLAGGFELMLVCDLVVASEDAVFGDQHINYGLVGGGGSTQRTPRLIPIRKAKELMFTGDRISAHEAERWGLINRVVPAEDLEKTAADLAAKVAEKSPVAIRMYKNLINRAMETDLTTGLELELMSTIVNSTSEDYQEGMKAFAEKRKPVFKSK